MYGHRISSLGVALLSGAALTLGASAQDAPVLDAELLLAHDGLFTGDLGSVVEDTLAALENDLESPLALDAVRRLDGLGGLDMGLFDDRARLEQLGRMARAATDPETELVLEQLYLAARARTRFSDDPVPLPEDLREEFVTHWRVIGPFGPAAEAFPSLLEPLEGTPEIAEDMADGSLGYADTYAGDLVLAGEPPAALRWQPVEREFQRTAMEPGRALWPHAGFVFAVCYVRVPGLESATDVVLELRTDDAYRAYWNGTLAHDAPRTTREDVGSRRMVRVTAEPGWNALLVRMPLVGAPRLGARLLDASRAELDYEVLGPDAEAPTFRPGRVGERLTEPRDEVLDATVFGPFAPAVSVVRRAYAQRPDEALAIAPPEDERGRAAWHLTRLFALDAAGHLDAELERRMVLADLDALEGDGRRYAGVRERRINWLLSEDRPLEALALAEEWRASFPDSMWARKVVNDVLDRVDVTGSLSMRGRQALVDAFPEYPALRAELAANMAREGARRRAVDLTWGVLQETSSLGLASAFLERLEGAQDPRVLELLGRVQAERALFPRMEELANLEGEILGMLDRSDALLARAEERAQALPTRPNPWWRLGVRRMRSGNVDGALEAFRTELTFRPADTVTRQIVAELGDVDPAERFFEEFAPDRDAVALRALEFTDASVLEVLDSGLLYVFPDGSTHARFTSIARPQDRAGVEALSKIPPREGTRSILVEKADGTIMEPTLAGGEWVLPKLETGDTIEIVWDQHTDAPAPGTEPAQQSWRFASFERAFPTSRWAVYTPDGLARGKLVARHFEGERSETAWGDGVVTVFESSLARQVPEPGMPAYEDILPIAGFGDDDDRSDERRAYLAFVERNTWIPADLAAGVDAYARETAEGLEPGPAARALYEAVDARTREFQGDGSAASVWQTKRGYPLFLYAALLERANVPFEWGVLETGVSPELNPRPETLFEGDFALGQVILRLAFDGEPVWVLPGNTPGTPFGELPNECAGAEVLVLGDDARREALPRAYLRDRWDAEIALEYDVDADGNARVRGRFANSGPEGVMALGQIRQATAEQRQGFALGQAGQLAPGTDVASAEVVLDGTAGPGLVVVFEGVRPGFAVEQSDGGSTARIPFLNLGLTQRFGPAERHWPLELRAPSRLRVEVTVRIDASLRLDRGPAPIEEVRGEGFRVALDLERPSDGVVRYVQTFEQRALVLQPDEMQGFLARMADVESEFERALRLERAE